MKINSNIFRAYDIRGIFPRDINEETAFFIGQAFAEFLKKTNKSKELKVAISRDCRVSSPILFRGLSKGILSSGVDIVNIGLATTAMLYFAVAHYKLEGGIEITASHNPLEYNGFKIVRETSFPVGSDNGLKEIEMLAQKFQEQKITIVGKKQGRISKKNASSDYIKFNLRDINLKKVKPLKLVVDTANGISGVIVPKILEKINLKIHYLFLKLDGNFPNHSPDPTKEENLGFLKKEVKRKKADLGVAFDGDGDRIVFVSEKGEMVLPDIIFALVSSHILKSNPGEKILYTIASSNIVRDTIKNSGGIPIMSPVGYTFIKEKMRKENIIFAGEYSSHYYPRNHYFSEAPFFVLFKILEIISESGEKFSEIISRYQRYFYSGNIFFKTQGEDFDEKKKKILCELEKKYKYGKILKIDGIRIDFPDWWFLLRPSNTEPFLKLIVEAKTKELMLGKKKELTKLISAHKLH
jgi:phosphomannomutase